MGTSADLAGIAGVSAPTVVRFARAMGYSGFTDLQAALVAELADRRASPTTRFPETRGSVNDRHWLRAGVEQASADVRDSLTDIPQSAVDAAVALLADPKKRITCVGGRFSNLVAEYLALHLQQIRPGAVSRADTSAFGPAHTIDVDRRDVYVVYDMRRYQRSTVERARQLKDRGAQLIVITDRWCRPPPESPTSATHRGRIRVTVRLTGTGLRALRAPGGRRSGGQRGGRRSAHQAVG